MAFSVISHQSLLLRLTEILTNLPRFINIQTNFFSSKILDLKELHSVEGNHKVSLLARYKANTEGNQYKVNIAVIYADISRNGGGGGGQKK